MEPDAEAINAEFKLIMSRIIARRIATDPEMIERAKAWYADWSSEDRASKPAIYWIETLEQGPEAVYVGSLPKMIRRSGCGIHRRSGSRTILTACATSSSGGGCGGMPSA